jgi:hypothetical protein
MPTDYQYTLEEFIFVILLFPTIGLTDEITGSG